MWPIGSLRSNEPLSAPLFLFLAFASLRRRNATERQIPPDDSDSVFLTFIHPSEQLSVFKLFSVELQVKS